MPRYRLRTSRRRATVQCALQTRLEARMLFLLIFLAGLGIGAALAYHLAGVPALKQRLRELDGPQRDN